MGGSEIIEESGGVIEIGGSYSDIHDAARAVKGLLKSVQTSIFYDNLHTPPIPCNIITAMFHYPLSRKGSYLFEVLCVQLEKRFVVHDAPKQHVPHPSHALGEHVLEAHLSSR